MAAAPSSSAEEAKEGKQTWVQAMDQVVHPTAWQPKPESLRKHEVPVPAPQSLLQQIIGMVMSCITFVVSFPVKIWSCFKFMVAGFFGLAARVSLPIWNIFVSACNFGAKICENIPIVGKLIAWFLLIPSKLKIPDWPILRMLMQDHKQQGKR